MYIPSVELDEQGGGYLGISEYIRITYGQQRKKQLFFCCWGGKWGSAMELRSDQIISDDIR